MTEPYDAIVVGLGVMGGAATCHLTKRGQRVLGIDTCTAGHDQGSSHGHHRLIRRSHTKYKDSAKSAEVQPDFSMMREFACQQSVSNTGQSFPNGFRRTKPMVSEDEVEMLPEQRMRAAWGRVNDNAARKNLNVRESATSLIVAEAHRLRGLYP